jgi:hypothetical protein
MKSAEDKARDFVSALPLSVAVVRKEVEALTVLLLKEQDTDSRKACAEAIMDVESDRMPTDACWKDDAHDACMNAKAV